MRFIDDQSLQEENTENTEERREKGASADIKIVLRSDTSQPFFEKSLSISYLDVF